MPFAHCVMTGLPLRYGPAVLIPLAPSGHAPGGRVHPTLAGQHAVITDGGRMGLFAPFALPLHVEVEEFGRVAAITPDDVAALTARRLTRLAPRGTDPTADGGPLMALARAATTRERLPAAVRLARSHARQWADLGIKATRESYGWDGRLSGTWASVEAWDRFSAGIYSPWEHEPAASLYPDLRKQGENLAAYRRALPPEMRRRVSRLSHLHGPAATLAPEMVALYGPTLFRESTLPALSGLLCFTINLALAGRFLAPVMASGQDTFVEVHAAIAEVARGQLDAYITARLDTRPSAPTTPHP